MELNSMNDAQHFCLRLKMYLPECQNTPEEILLLLMGAHMGSKGCNESRWWEKSVHGHRWFIPTNKLVERYVGHTGCHSSSAHFNPKAILAGIKSEGFDTDEEIIKRIVEVMDDDFIVDGLEHHFTSDGHRIHYAYNIATEVVEIEQFCKLSHVPIISGTIVGTTTDVLTGIECTVTDEKGKLFIGEEEIGRVEYVSGVLKIFNEERIAQIKFDYEHNPNYSNWKTHA